MEERRRLIEAGGGAKGVEQQRKAGKGTARERIGQLLDEGSFVEIGAFVQGGMEDAGADIKNPAEGVVTGCGLIGGRKVYLYAQDFTVAGGSVGEAHAQKICRVLDLAGQSGAPVIALLDSGGARLDDGIAALDGYGSIFYRQSLYSGVIPQVAVVMGPCAGGAAYQAALADFVFMVEGTGSLFVTGPQVIEAVTGECATLAELGGAGVHSSTSGAVHFLADDEAAALSGVRLLLGYLPLNNVEDPPRAEPLEPSAGGEGLGEVIPGIDEPYDVREIINRVVDGGSFYEVHRGYAQNAVVGFARLGGRAVGLVANQPLVKEGFIDNDASEKISRFVRFCDAFNLALFTLVDVPGYLPGVGQERGGAVRRGAKMIYAYAEATVPKFSLVLRRAYGSAFAAMGSRSLGADLCLAWPGAEIAVMEPEGAVEILHEEELGKAGDFEKRRGELARGYRERVANPYLAASRGWIDDVIEPRQTRSRLIGALQMAGTKRIQRLPRKHGNMPL